MAGETPALPSFDALNTCGEEDFFSALRFLFEHAPTLISWLFRDRPYASWGEMIDHAEELLASASTEDKVAILQAHPQIGAPKQSLSALSRKEQSHGPETSEETLMRLRKLNQAYTDKFGFTFMIFVNGRTRADLLPEFEARMGNPRAQEMTLGLAALFAVARDRLRGLVATGSGKL